MSMDNLEAIIRAGAEATPEQKIEMLKALGLGSYTTDVAAYTEGSTLVAEDFDKDVAESTYGDNSFKYLDSLPSEQVGDIKVRWTDRTDIGGVVGETRSNAAGITAEGTSEFNSHVTKIEFYATVGGTFDSLTTLKNALPEVSQEDIVAARRVKRDQSYDLWDGDNDASPSTFAGYKKIIETLGNYDGLHIADLWNDGAYSGLDANFKSNLLDIDQACIDIGEVVNRPQNGTNHATDLFMGSDVYRDYNQVKDFSQYRIMTPNGRGSNSEVMRGALISGIANRFGHPDSQDTLAHQDRYIKTGEEMTPAQFRSRNGVSTQRPVAAPQTVVGTPNAAVPGSRFVGAAWAGNYTYYVEAIDQFGLPSNVTASAAVAVAAGGSVTLVITHSAGGLETGFKIYRSRRNSAAGGADSRLMVTIPKATSGGTTTWTDLNQKLPNAKTLFVLDKTNVDSGGKRLYTMPFTRLLLPKTAAQIFKSPFGIGNSMGLLVKRPRANGLIVNCIAGDTWRPA